MRRTSPAKTGAGFDAVPGNDRVKKILRLALEKGRVPNSLIFSGPRGVGKRRLAVILAQALNCERGRTEPCGVCPVCRKVAEGKLPDVWGVGPDGQWIKIGQMQEVRQAAYVRPLESRRRVFIINDADKMNDEAANCLLKILEEPPAYSHIILVTSMAHLILPTIKSRCQVLSFAPIGREEIKAVLVERGKPEEQAGVIALLVNGNLEEALELDWNNVQENRREAWALFEALQGRGEASAFLRSYAFAKRDLVRDDFEKVLGILASFCRDASLLKTGGDAAFLLNPDYADALRNLETSWGPEAYASCLNKIEQAISGLRKSLNMSLLVMSFYSLMGELSHG
jgi:DNA polymerase III subunit delta'